MQRGEKSERSRRQVLDAALHLFSHQGFRGTSVRDIAERARVSIGNVYHHFPDKEALFTTLLDELFAMAESDRFPFRRAVTHGQFPRNLENLGYAARESVLEYRQHMALIYVDVIEFEGTHIQRFYADMARMFARYIALDGIEEDLRARLRPGVEPVDALLLTWRIFFNYFSIELLFHVPEPFGQDTAQVVRKIADILRHGILPQENQ